MGKRRCDNSCVIFADGNTHEMEIKVFTKKELVYIEKLQGGKKTYRYHLSQQALI